MKLLVLQHVPFEGPAAIKSWAERHNHTVIHHCCTQNTAYPNPADIDCCIILGGPMSVNDQSPWMKPEIDFIKACIKADKFMLGICLGAQLIATAMHAPVSKSSHLEIGWFAGADLEGNPIAIGEHCYGCTAGQGSSCGGTLN